MQSSMAALHDAARLLFATVDRQPDAQVLHSNALATALCIAGNTGFGTSLRWCTGAVKHFIF